jgi:2-polyprenyl-6-methoxyphenol hydroxylase-like FAD-dependent oxidoreductase
MADPKIHRCCDVAIAGGGPVGLTLALALAHRGYDAAWPMPGAPPGNGLRTAGRISSPMACWRIFKALGLEQKLLAGAEPVLQVEAEGRIGGINRSLPKTAPSRCSAT